MNPAIEIKNVSFTYPNGFEALKDLNFNIYQNELVAIIGQNGAGKSTLLKNLTGLLKPTEGDILVNGSNTKDITIAKLSTKLGFVLQNPDRQLFADTVREEIEFGPRNLKLSQEEIDARVEDALVLTGLKGHRDDFPPSLSAGEREKVVVASVVAMRPDIIILDEPTTGQDYRGCHQIMDIAKRFHEAGHTVIIVTHDMSLVAEYAKRTIVFCRGQVLLDDTTANVFSQPEVLKQAYVIPPQVTRAGVELSIYPKSDKVFLNTGELAGRLLDEIELS